MSSKQKKASPELLQEIANGNEYAFTKVFEDYKANIYTTALRLTDDEWVAEEILQDTFVKVWINRTELPAIESFDGWLFTIARNLTFNALKRTEKEKQNLLSLTKDSIELFYPEDEYQNREKGFQEILDKAIERLPPKQQATYKLIKQQHLKRAQAAEQLNVSPETIKWNLDQAMRSIRAYCVAHAKDLPLIYLLHFFSKYF
ncbi:sigma-70 family RNA polymerase sigma factor [Pedobacter sp. MC2016-14]|uniref:RNA polymerase sigma factor n=1 Tax=Pedobacter sp. MC2016-14 TaxID=2897327 RepID=UPI001E48F12B|nr:sigma-70 family RNA polymerase sigma factor [Pedobacter sp. MC2016-14]MCD0489155.1 sigma-70 family RNA polymerase sigma factor [Pedobacter sp. MC2016-14]